MNKGKLIVYIAAVLIILNGLFLAFKFLKPHQKNHHQKEGPQHIIIKKLNFNKNQVKEYKLLIQEHRQAVLKVEKEIRNIKTDLYNTILNTEIPRDSLLNEIAKKQIEIEQVHLSHFEDIKTICESEQLPAFELLVNDLSKMFKGAKHNPMHNKNP